MGSTWHSVTAAVVLFLLQSTLLHAHREHKVHNIVLYPDKHSWCKTTPIKQVVTWSQCSSLELDNNVCVGACFSYMVPHSEPSAPGDLIRPYCDSCQPLDSVWHTVTLDCKDEDNNPITMQKKVQIITNCSCSSCTEPSRIKPDYNTLLQSLTEENLDKNVNLAHETPDLLLDVNLNQPKNITKEGAEAYDKYLQFSKLRLKESKKTDEPGTKELFAKFEEEIELEKLKELVNKYSKENERHQQHQQHQQHHQQSHHQELQHHQETNKQQLHHQEAGKHELQQHQETKQQQQAQHESQHKLQQELQQPQQQQEQQQKTLEEQQHQQHQQHHGTPTLLHRGPHHSLVLDADVKEKIDVEPHYLHPAVAGQEISYHDNVLVEKGKKKDF